MSIHMSIFSICTYECIYVWAYVYMSICTYEYIHIWVHVCTCVCMHLWAHVSMYVWVCMTANICTIFYLFLWNDNKVKTRLVHLNRTPFLCILFFYVSSMKSSNNHAYVANMPHILYLYSLFHSIVSLHADTQIVFSHGDKVKIEIQYEKVYLVPLCRVAVVPWDYDRSCGFEVLFS